MKQDQKDILKQRLTHYAGPVEVHITVSIENTQTAKHLFATACTALGGKHIWIELDQGSDINQPMFGARLPAMDPDKQADAISKWAEQLGAVFEIIRVKVEASPFNQNIPQSKDAASDEPSDCYFEHHVAVELTADSDIDELRQAVAEFDGYLSRNAFKPGDGHHTRFITQRFYGIGQPDADKRLNAMKRWLIAQNLPISSEEREYNIFDSNVALDQGWMV